LTANGSSTGLATFRSIIKKYPGRDPKKILLELATSDSSISPLNLQTRAERIRARSAAHRATCSKKMPGFAWK